jgi:hypothetical protein
MDEHHENMLEVILDRCHSLLRQSSRIEQKEDANAVKLDEIIEILKNQPGVAVAVKTQFEKEK